MTTAVLPTTCTPRARPSRRGDGSTFPDCRECGEVVHLADAVELADATPYCLNCARVAFCDTSVAEMIEGALLAPEGSRR